MTPETQERIQNMIQENPVVLFMKGSADFPQCGFSYHVVQILREENIHFFDVNVLEDDTIRQGIKAFSDWPTIPQLYVNGEFIGGCDIAQELHASGELKEMLQNYAEND